MARFNKIFLGPVEKNKPQAFEAIAAAALKPGRLAVLTTGKLALAAADTVGKVYIVQDNYLALKGVDVDWAADSRAVALEMLPDEIYAGRIANGVNVTAKGTALTPGANGTFAIAGAGDFVIAYSEEAFNNNTGSEQLIKIRPAGQSYLAAAGG